MDRPSLSHELARFAWVLVCAAWLAGCTKTSPPDPSPPFTKKTEAAMHVEPAPTPAALRDKALVAFFKTGEWPDLSPILPAHWPMAGGEVLWLVYAAQELGTGMPSQRIHGPIGKVSLRLPDGEPVAETFAGKPVLLGETNPGIRAPDLDAAQSALIEVALGRLAPESAKAKLRTYLAWADDSPIPGKDIRARNPEFFAWLEAGTQ